MPSAPVKELFDRYHIDIPKVMRRYPYLASYNVQRVEEVCFFLEKLGVDVKRAVEISTALLAGQVERYAAVVQLLQANGVDVPRAVNRYPNVLRRSLDALQHIFDSIASNDCSTADVVNRSPSILRASAANVSSIVQLRQLAGNAIAPDKASTNLLGSTDPKAALLLSLGLDANHVLKKAPELLRITYENLYAVVKYLDMIGVDVKKVAQKAPNSFGIRPELLKRRVQFLSQNGLDMLRHVNGNPMVLYYSVEHKLQPILAFVLNEMGRPVSDLNAASNLWCYNLEGRLRPRFLYLKSVGRSEGHLASFGSFSDQRFAITIAGTDLQHYHKWRRQNGFLVPSSTVSPPQTVPSSAN